MKAYWGSGGTATITLKLGTTWKWLVTLTPRQLYPRGKSPWYPLNRRLSGPQSQSGRFGGKKNILFLPEFETRIVHPRDLQAKLLLLPDSRNSSELMTYKSIWRFVFHDLALNNGPTWLLDANCRTNLLLQQQLEFAAIAAKCCNNAATNLRHARLTICPESLNWF